jgi:dihydrolipoamide dehydrogenase
MAETYDLVVIGSGPGGYVAAIRASQLGMKSAVIEKERVGGVCLNWGCIPTKALLHSASLYDTMMHGADFGVQATELSVDFKKMIKQSRTAAQRLSKGVEYLFKKNKIEKIEGTGRIQAKDTVQVTDSAGQTREVKSRYILIASGARPRSLPGVEFDNDRIISSKEAMSLDSQPSAMIIIGAGAIGAEFAYFYATIGTKVTLVEMMPQLLPQEDVEISREVEKSFKKRGIHCLTDTRVEKIDKTEKGVVVTINTPKGEQTVEGDVALLAIGVQGNVEELGLEALGIGVERGAIQVDRQTYQAAESIYAIGDVVGPPWLAHVASAEGIVAVEHMDGKTPHPVNYHSIPACTYCEPQVASLGLTEAQAREHHDIRVGRFPLRANGKALAMGHTDGFIKLIFDTRYDELLGAHLVGPDATELLSGLGIARTLETTADELMHTIIAHPTVSEIIKEAAEDAFGQAIHI